MLEKKILIPVRWALAPILVCTGAAAWAASVQAVSGSQQGGGEVVRIALSEPLKDAVTGFAIQSPARIALDLPGATNAMGQSLVELQQGNLDTVNVVEGTGRTRVVLNLKAPTTYRTQVDGNGILVFLVQSNVRRRRLRRCNRPCVSIWPAKRWMQARLGL